MLIGATTENPSFEVNAALLSRSKVFVLQPLDRGRDRRDPARALADSERGLGGAGRRRRRRGARGDRPARQRRRARGAQPARADAPAPTDPRAASRSTRRAVAEAISAGRCSTTRAARSTTTSSPRCTSRCATAIPTPPSTGWRACSRPARIRCTSRAGWCASPPRTSATPIRRRWRSRWPRRTPCTSSACPEGNTALAQAAIYLATAPKSNAVYIAYGAAAEARPQDAAEPVPLHLRNAPTRLMKELGYGKGYEYAHDEPTRSRRHGLPAAGAQGPAVLQADDRGFEKEIKRLSSAAQAIPKANGSSKQTIPRPDVQLRDAQLPNRIGRRRPPPTRRCRRQSPSAHESSTCGTSRAAAAG